MDILTLDPSVDLISDAELAKNAENNYITVPPDGGYGWVIVFAAFMSNFVVDGIANSFGAFMSVYQENFDASKAKVSLIGSLLIGFYLLVGKYFIIYIFFFSAKI